jgi:hypothetical protein
MKTAQEQQPDQQGGTGPELQEQQEQRRVPGRPFAPGDPRINRQGRRRAGTEEEEAEEVALPGGFDLLGQMEALLQRPASQDRGETQKGLREWYKGDIKGFMGQLAGLKKEQMRAAGREGDGKPCPECARRKAEEEAKTDEGTERVLALAHDLMSRWNVEAHIGREIGKKWFDLTMQQRLAILEMTGVPHTFEVNPGREGTPTLSVLTEYGTVDGARSQADREGSEGS